MSLDEQMQKINELRKQAEEVTAAAIMSLHQVFKSATPELREWILKDLTQVDKELREQEK